MKKSLKKGHDENRKYSVKRKNKSETLKKKKVTLKKYKVDKKSKSSEKSKSNGHKKSNGKSKTNRKMKQMANRVAKRRSNKRKNNKRKNSLRTGGGIFTTDKEVVLERKLNEYLGIVNGALTNYYDKLTVFGNNLAEKHIKNYNILINSIFINVYKIGSADLSGDILQDIQENRNKLIDGLKSKYLYSALGQLRIAEMVFNKALSDFNRIQLRYAAHFNTKTKYVRDVMVDSSGMDAVKSKDYDKKHKIDMRKEKLKEYEENIKNANDKDEKMKIILNYMTDMDSAINNKLRALGLQRYPYFTGAGARFSNDPRWRLSKAFGVNKSRTSYKRYVMNAKLIEWERKQINIRLLKDFIDLLQSEFSENRPIAPPQNPTVAIEMNRIISDLMCNNIDGIGRTTQYITARPLHRNKILNKQTNILVARDLGVGGIFNNYEDLSQNKIPTFIESVIYMYPTASIKNKASQEIDHIAKDLITEQISTLEKTLPKKGGVYGPNIVNNDVENHNYTLYDTIFRAMVYDKTMISPSTMLPATVQYANDKLTKIINTYGSGYQINGFTDLIHMMDAYMFHNSLYYDLYHILINAAQDTSNFTKIRMSDMFVMPVDGQGNHSWISLIPTPVGHPGALGTARFDPTGAPMFGSPLPPLGGPTTSPTGGPTSPTGGPPIPPGGPPIPPISPPTHPLFAESFVTTPLTPKPYSDLGKLEFNNRHKELFKLYNLYELANKTFMIIIDPDRVTEFAQDDNMFFMLKIAETYGVNVEVVMIDNSFTESGFKDSMDKHNEKMKKLLDKTGFIYKTHDQPKKIDELKDPLGECKKIFKYTYTYLQTTSLDSNCKMFTINNALIGSKPIKYIGINNYISDSDPTHFVVKTDNSYAININTTYYEAVKKNDDHNIGIYLKLINLINFKNKKMYNHILIINCNNYKNDKERIDNAVSDIIHDGKRIHTTMDVNKIRIIIHSYTKFDDGNEITVKKNESIGIKDKVYKFPNVIEYVYGSSSKKYYICDTLNLLKYEHKDTTLGGAVGSKVTYFNSYYYKIYKNLEETVNKFISINLTPTRPPPPPPPKVMKGGVIENFKPPSMLNTDQLLLYNYDNMKKMLNNFPNAVNVDIPNENMLMNMKGFTGKIVRSCVKSANRILTEIPDKVRDPATGQLVDYNNYITSTSNHFNQFQNAGQFNAVQFVPVNAVQNSSGTYTINTNKQSLSGQPPLPTAGPVDHSSSSTNPATNPAPTPAVSSGGAKRSYKNPKVLEKVDKDFDEYMKKMKQKKKASNTKNIKSKKRKVVNEKGKIDSKKKKN